MGLIVTDSNKPDFPITPAGLHAAVCYGVIDLGTQKPNPGSTFAPKRKAVILFEIPNERFDLTQNGETVNVARTISRAFTLSLNPKAKLSEFLVSWRGREFTKEERSKFELKTLLGVNAQLVVVHRNNSNGKTSAGILNVLPPVKGAKPMKPENDIVFFSFTDAHALGRVEFPVTVPNWIKKQAMESPEYAAIVGAPKKQPDPLTSGNQSATSVLPQNTVKTEQENIDEDAPF